MRLLHALKNSRWMLWSSPVLLVVLVLTLTTTKPISHNVENTSQPSTSPSTTPPTTRRSLTTTTTTSTSTSSVTTTTKHPAPTSSTSHASRRRAVLTLSSPTVASHNYTTPSHPRSNNTSSAVTDSSVTNIAPANAQSASSGVLQGQLGPNLTVAEVPLRGPATWSLVASAPIRATLACSNLETIVTNSFVVAKNVNCQLSIQPSTPIVVLTWQLSPTS